MPDGKSIISGWSDGKIRSFTPQTGRLIFAIENAHSVQFAGGSSSQGVSSILGYHADSPRIVSGGFTGEIRVWKLTKSCQILEKNLKEHKAKVTCIEMICGDTICDTTIRRCVSSSNDGSCIVWDITAGTRLVCVFESTNFRSVAFSLDGGSQFVAIGTDGKIYYYDTFNGELLRELMVDDGTSLECMNLMCNEKFVIGKSDGSLVMYDYDQGSIECSGKWIGGDITAVGAVCLSSGVSSAVVVVTGSADGALNFWSTTV